MQDSYCLFETAIGCCALAWRGETIVGVQLPEATAEHTESRIKARFPNAASTRPTKNVARVVKDIIALMRGEARDFNDVTLAVNELPEFQRDVYALARTIPAGKTLTYGEIAKKLNAPGAARAVGQA